MKYSPAENLMTLFFPLISSKVKCYRVNWKAIYDLLYVFHTNFSHTISAQSLPPIGGRLSAFSAEWTKIGASQWVLRTLLEGYSLPFSSLPPLTSPVFLASYQNPEKRRALHDAVKEMEMKGAIEVIRTPSPGFYSRLFLVPKAGGHGGL